MPGGLQLQLDSNSGQARMGRVPWGTDICPSQAGRLPQHGRSQCWGLSQLVWGKHSFPVVCGAPASESGVSNLYRPAVEAASL